MRITLMARRKRERMTQTELAEKLGITKEHLSKIENGRTNGSQKFWDRLKELWNIPNEEMEDYREKV